MSDDYNFPPGDPCAHCGGPTLRDPCGADADYCEACGTAWANNGRAGQP